MLTIRQYLRSLDKEKLRNLFEQSRLTSEEYKLVSYAFINKYLVAKSCELLGMSKTKYHSCLNEALAKINFQLSILNSVLFDE